MGVGEPTRAGAGILGGALAKSDLATSHHPVARPAQLFGSDFG
jgi:hypothetical protein